jgi:hypothetical protein
MVLIDSEGQLGVPVSSARYKRDIHALGERSRGCSSFSRSVFATSTTRRGSASMD